MRCALIRSRVRRGSARQSVSPERFATIWRNIGTGDLSLKYAEMKVQNTDPCRGGIQNLGDPGGGLFLLLGAVHTHLFRGPTNSQPAEIFPDNCPASHAGGYAGPEFIPSDQDWANAGHIPNRGATIGYIVGKSYVTRFDAKRPAAGDRTKRDSLTQKWKWNDTGCRWRGMRAPPA